MFVAFAICALIVSTSAYSNVQRRQLACGIPQYSSFTDEEHKYFYVPTSSTNTFYNLRLTRYDSFKNPNSTQSVIVSHDGVTEYGTHDIHFTARNLVEISVSGSGEEGFAYSLRLCEGECQNNCNGECNGHGGCGVLGNNCHCDIGFGGSNCDRQIGDSASTASSTTSSEEGQAISGAVLAGIIVGSVFVFLVVLFTILGCTLYYCFNNLKADGEEYVFDPTYHEEVVTDCAHACPCCACCTCCTVRMSYSGFRKQTKAGTTQGGITTPLNSEKKAQSNTEPPPPTPGDLTYVSSGFGGDSHNDNVKPSAPPVNPVTDEMASIYGY